MNLQHRIADALEASALALEVSLRETGRPWQAVALIAALQGALIAALSGYDTAHADDVQDPLDERRRAPVALLLRRAASPEFLSDPERLHLTRADQRRLQPLIDARNRLLHGQSEAVHFDGEAIHTVLTLLNHLLITAPAFTVSPQDLIMARIKTALAAHFPLPDTPA